MDRRDAIALVTALHQDDESAYMSVAQQVLDEDALDGLMIVSALALGAVQKLSEFSGIPVEEILEGLGRANA